MIIRLAVVVFTRVLRNSSCETAVGLPRKLNLDKKKTNLSGSDVPGAFINPGLKKKTDTKTIRILSKSRNASDIIRNTFDE